MHMSGEAETFFSVLLLANSSLQLQPSQPAEHTDQISAHECCLHIQQHAHTVPWGVRCVSLLHTMIEL